MRLYLSSDGLGEHPDELLKLLHGGKRAAVIVNAIDYRDTDDRLNLYQQEWNELTQLGLEPTEIDLRVYFGKKEALKEELNKYNLLWVRGGNTFLLRRAFAYSGADEIVTTLLKEDTIVYGGYSAGAILPCMTLHGIEFADDPYEITNGYKDKIIWDGLTVLPYLIIPHYKSGYAGIDEAVDYCKEHQLPFKTLMDGEVIVINEETERILR